jgi:hypothetical protein
MNLLLSHKRLSLRLRLHLYLKLKSITTEVTTKQEDSELSRGQIIEGVGDFISQMMYLVMQCKRKVVPMLVVVEQIGAARVV